MSRYLGPAVSWKRRERRKEMRKMNDCRVIVLEKILFPMNAFIPLIVYIYRYTRWHNEPNTNGLNYAICTG